MSGITIRRAKRGERLQLEDLQRRASLALPDYRAQLEAHPDAISLPAEHICSTIVAEQAGALLGFAVILIDDEQAELDGLFVEPTHWKLGVGRALVREAIHEARRQGLSLKVVANPAARGFYERCGFAAEGEVPTRFGPAIAMSR